MFKTKDNKTLVADYAEKLGLEVKEYSRGDDILVYCQMESASIDEIYSVTGALRGKLETYKVNLENNIFILTLEILVENRREKTDLDYEADFVESQERG
jgi:hypothetical protein